MSPCPLRRAGARCSWLPGDRLHPGPAPSGLSSPRLSLQRPSGHGGSGMMGAAGRWPRATSQPLARAGSQVPLDLGVSVSPGSLPLPLPPEAPEPHGPRVPMPRDRLPVTDRTFLLLLSSQSVTFAKKKGLSPTGSCLPVGCACHPSIALVPLTAKARTGRAV